MNSYSKTLILALASIFLSGCLEVEDDSNDDVVAALEAQNAILQQQTASVTLFGNVVDAGEGTQILNAKASVKIGANWREPVDISGEFQIEELPANTDVVVLIQSTDDSFLERAFYGRTSATSGNQVAFQSIGDLKVSKAVVKTYAILDAETNTAFEGLTFSYNPTSYFTSSYNPTSYFTSYNIQNNYYVNIDSYKVSSSFDSTTGLYSIILPEDISVEVSASADIDGDEINDFVTENNNFWYANTIRLNSEQALELETLYVSKTPAYQAVELRISVIDERGNPFEEVDFFEDDQFIGHIDAMYDADTKEYVFYYQTSSQLSLNMASFISNDNINYQSASLSLSQNDAESLSINDSGFSNNIASQIQIVEGVVLITVQPNVAYTPNSYISTESSIIDENDGYSLKDFYQLPVALLNDSIVLNRENVLAVIKGDDIANDLVAEGTTDINLVSEAVAIDTTLSHNNTFVTAKATSQLSSGDYSYQVNNLVNSETNEEFAKNSTKNFTIEPLSSELAFDINDIKLDNNNGTTNGLAIVATNTANIANTAYDAYGSAYLYFPTSIKVLDYFQLTLVSSVKSGNPYVHNSQINLIDDSHNYSSYYLVHLAANENIRTNRSFNYLTKTALTDGLWYRYYSNFIYTMDDTQASENSATFNYIYRVAGQENTVEGTITLPVL